MALPLKLSRASCLSDNADVLDNPEKQVEEHIVRCRWMLSRGESEGATCCVQPSFSERRHCVTNKYNFVRNESLLIHIQLGDQVTNCLYVTLAEFNICFYRDGVFYLSWRTFDLQSDPRLCLMLPAPHHL